MQIEDINLTDLRPYENNPRNNAKAVEAVANSIREFGFKVPIVIDKDNVIICGHTRAKASEKLGLKTVPCIRADTLYRQDKRGCYKLHVLHTAGHFVFYGCRLVFAPKGNTSASWRYDGYVSRGGTYLKSFYSVMWAPSCVKIGAMGDTHKRIHHSITWDKCAPKILSEKWKKQR